jgi:O-antigen/teichoic acid export membrane protein
LASSKAVGAAASYMVPSTRQGIATRTVRGVSWAYGSYVGGRLLSLVATAILARLISPKDFGVVALALVAMAFLDTFPGLGVGEALVVVDPGEIEEKAETAFAVQIVVGLVLAAAAAALGPLAASFFHQPRLVGLMPVLGLIFVVAGLGSTHSALAQKRLDFRSLTIAELADVVSRGVVSIALAVMGAGVWSLVIGYVFGKSAWTIAIWHRVRWRPRFRPKREHLRGLLTFGGTLTGVGMMAAFLTQFDNLVIGRVLGAAELGFYVMATRLPELFILGLAVAAGRVLFPAFASLDGSDMTRGFVTALRYTAMVVLPLAVFMIVLARPLVIALFGERWRPAIPATQVLTLWALASTMLFVCGNAFKGRGRPDILLKLSVPQAVLLIGGSLAFVKQGITAVSWVQAGIAIAAQLAALIIARRMFDVSLGSVLEAIRPALFASAGLAVTLLVVERAISAPWPALVIGASAGIVVYTGLLAVLARDALSRLIVMAVPPTARSELRLEMQNTADPLDEAGGNRT